MKMGHGNQRLWPVGFLLAALVAGCTTKPMDQPAPLADADEAAVRERFAELQSAIKKQDAEKIWEMLDAKSKADAERVVKEIISAYEKADPKEKTELEDALGLKADGMAALTAPGYLKTKRFQKKYDELPDSKIEKVVVRTDGATLHYLEPDGDKEKLIFLRQGNSYQALLAIPKLKRPTSPP